MRYKHLQDWLEWLESLAPPGHKFKLSLSHLRPIAEHLQLINFSIPVVLVGGTNGKGTSIALLAKIYASAGYRVASYTSPHLISFTERLQFNNEQLSEAVWCKAFAKIDSARGEVALSYFEFSTLAGLWLIKQHHAELDVALLEIGCGGRLDAMNIVNPDVSVITTIALDHMEFLGNTREAIAQEKAGIMRANQPIVCGDFDPPKSIAKQAETLQAILYCQNKDFKATVAAQSWVWQAGDVIINNLPIPQIPLQNAATVLQVVQLLQDRLPVSVDRIKYGVEHVRLHGRMQHLHDKPEVIADVAHNPHAANYLFQQLPKQRKNTGRIIAVVGMKKDKDIAKTLAIIKPLVSHWYVASLIGYCETTAEQLMVHLSDCSAQAFNDVQSAYRQALTDAKDDDTILVFGSFHIVGPVLEIANEQSTTKT